METLTIAGAVAGITQFVKLAGAKFGFPVGGPYTIVVAGIVGLALGFLGVEGTTPVTGFIGAVVAVGTLTVANKVSGN